MPQSSGKVKASQLWNKNKDELTKQLGELKTELGQLRIQKIASSGSKLNKMCVYHSNPPIEVRRRVWGEEQTGGGGLGGSAKEGRQKG